MNVVDRIVQTLQDHGGGAYFGEAVSECEHACQCAHLARMAGADDTLIAATLLHDVGHLLHNLGEDFSERGIDDRHEDAGAQFLAGHFPPAVVDPVRLHVAAKRYLCTVEPEYLAGLSPASRRSLEIQGGTMTSDELRAFEAEPHFQAAIALRRFDDGGKIAGWQVPGPESYRSLLESLYLGGEKH